MWQERSNFRPWGSFKYQRTESSWQIVGLRPTDPIRGFLFQQGQVKTRQYPLIVSMIAWIEVVVFLSFHTRGHGNPHTRRRVIFMRFNLHRRPRRRHRRTDLSIECLWFIDRGVSLRDGWGEAVASAGGQEENASNKNGCGSKRAHRARTDTHTHTEAKAKHNVPHIWGWFTLKDISWGLVLRASSKQTLVWLSVAGQEWIPERPRSKSLVCEVTATAVAKVGKRREEINKVPVSRWGWHRRRNLRRSSYDTDCVWTGSAGMKATYLAAEPRRDINNSPVSVCF